MEIMEFVLGLYVGLAAGFILRSIAPKLENGIRHYGSETKSKH